jgi:5-methyltetrahydropteroyltriglutamate--homocysteine methyltransferase
MSHASPPIGPPFRAEHVGSLLRPPELREARRAHEAGRMTEDALREAEDAAIVGAIRMQEELGLQAITDGEFRREKYFTHFAKAVEGFARTEGSVMFHDESGEPMRYTTDVIVGRLRRVHGIATDEYAFVRANTSRTPKVTLPDPASQHHFRYQKGVSDAAYPDLDELFADVARIYREELAELADMGATYVQLDDVAFPLLCDDRHRAEVQAGGHDPDELLERYVDLTNSALAGRPPSLTVAMHLCRGNNQGKWLGEGDYEPVAEQVFGRLAVDALLLEYDTERAGGFEPLRFLAPDKTAVLGLVSTKTPTLERRDDVLQRIDEASRHVPIERLAISPQCGFASVEEGNPISPEDQRRKLELVVDVAATVWPAG